MSKCTKCGKCCYNWITKDMSSKCEYLDNDLKTCLIYEEWEAFGLKQCRDELALSAASSLPDECGYIQDWNTKGLIKKDKHGRWQPII